MDTDVGRPPASQGRATRPTDQAPAGLGDTASVPNASWRLPINAGVCAFDRDECTVTIALDTEADVDALVSTIPSRRRVRFAALEAAIARKNAERGRELTDRERLENLAAWLAESEDEDGLDAIQALVCDAAAAEPARMVHEGGEYYAERIIRRAIVQGTIRLAGELA